MGARRAGFLRKEPGLSKAVRSTVSHVYGAGAPIACCLIVGLGVSGVASTMGAAPVALIKHGAKAEPTASRQKIKQSKASDS